MDNGRNWDEKERAGIWLHMSKGANESADRIAKTGWQRSNGRGGGGLLGVRSATLPPPFPVGSVTPPQAWMPIMHAVSYRRGFSLMNGDQLKFRPFISEGVWSCIGVEGDPGSREGGQEGEKDSERQPCKKQPADLATSTGSRC